MRLKPLAFATFLVWRLRIGACGVGACGFWRLRQLPEISTNKIHYATNLCVDTIHEGQLLNDGCLPWFLPK